MAQTAAILQIMVKANTGQATAGLKKTDQQLRNTSKTTNAARDAFGKAAKAAIGLAGAYAGIQGAKRAVATTEDLAKTTLSLHKNLGLSVKTSSEFGAVLKARGADTRQVNMAFAAFSRNVEAAKNGTAAAADAFKALGISQKELASLKPEEVIHEIADGMERLGPGTERTAIGAKLFGRGWQALIPILRGGSGELQKQLDLANKYGATFGGKSVKSIEDLIAAQREAKIAGIGLQIAFGTQVAPALTKVIGVASQAALAFKGLRDNVKLFAASGVGLAGLAVAFGPITAGVAAAAAGVLVLARNWSTVGPAVQRALGLSGPDIEKLRQAVTNAWTAIRAVTNRVWPGIKQQVQGTLQVIGGIVKVFSGLLTGDFRRMWNGVKQISGGALKQLGGIIRAATAPFRAAAAAAFGPIRSTVSSVMRGALKVVGDAIAGMLRRFAALFDIAGKIPGIGGKFRALAAQARGAADRVDNLGESVRKLPSRKDVKVNLKFHVPGVGTGSLPGLVGGSGQMIDEGIQKASQTFANSNKSKFAPLFEGQTGVLGTAKGSLGKYEALGHKFGLATTSGFRPGDPGWHGKNRARDLSNGVGTPQELAFARAMSSRYGSRLLELIHTPLGYGIKNGKRVPLSFWGSKTNAAHYNHVHVAAQKGAMVPGTGTGDKVRALLEPGEGIINKKAVRAMGGATTINSINRMVPRFQKGGAVTAASAAYKAGFRGNNLLRMMMIAGRESGYNPRAQNLNAATGDHSIGLWQINQLAHHGRFGTDAQLKDPFRNARAAWNLYRSSGLTPWHGMVNTARFRGVAQRAIAALKRGGGGKAAPKKKALVRHRLPNGDILIGGRRTSELIATDVTRGALKGTPSRGNRPGRIISPVSDFGEALGDTATSNPVADAIAAHTEAVKASADVAAGLRAEIAESNRIANSRVAIGLREAERALGDMISGQLGTRTAQRGQTAGDGQTMARI